MNYLDITLSIGASVNGKHAHSTEHKQYSIYLTAEPSHSEEIKSRPEVITATA